MADTVYHVTLFGLEFDIKPVAFSLPIAGGWDIYWYGILISLGFGLAILYAMKRAKSFELNPDKVIDVILVSTPVSIICARAYYLLFDGVKTESIAGFFDIHSGGMAIYGGVIGAFLSAALMCKIRKINMLDLFDLGAIGFFIGQAIGRWGNFFNQEAYGTFTNSSWWGMTSNRIQEEYGYGLVHPCFLYESVWCLIGFIILHTLSRRRKFKGELFLMYGALYGIGRFFIEGLRTDSLMIGDFRVSKWLSLLLFAGCSLAIGIILIKLKNESQQEYTPLFEGIQLNADTDTHDITDENIMKDEGTGSGEDKGYGAWTDEPSEDADDSDILDNLDENAAEQFLNAMGGIEAERTDDLGENTYDPTIYYSENKGEAED
ncbi:MAG TPA: prolipoprotein diacylglyceryl transferase [Clostridiales bacterium]|nr:prolipoprotein diacylglyceryl transferase [Clostridiales bacterium]